VRDQIGYDPAIVDHALTDLRKALNEDEGTQYIDKPRPRFLRFVSHDLQPVAHSVASSEHISPPGLEAAPGLQSKTSLASTESRQQQSFASHPAEKKELWNIPPCNPFFTGREE